MSRVCHYLLLRDKVRFLLEQKYFRLQNYKPVVGSWVRGRKFIFHQKKICGKSGYYFSLINTYRNSLTWLVLLIISSCKSLTSPPEERKQRASNVQVIGTTFRNAPSKEMFSFLPNYVLVIAYPVLFNWR